METSWVTALLYLNYSLLFCVSERAENAASCRLYWETTPSLLCEGRKRCQRCWQVASGFCETVWWGLFYRKWVALGFSQAYFKWKRHWSFILTSTFLLSLWSLSLFYCIHILLSSPCCVSAIGGRLKLCLRPVWKRRQPSPTWARPSARSSRMSGMLDARWKVSCELQRSNVYTNNQ